jgi:hypothetical protein
VATITNFYALINGCLTLELPALAGEPTFADIQLTKRLINANTFSFPSVLVDGHRDHLDIIMTAQE